MAFCCADCRHFCIRAAVGWLRNHVLPSSVSTVFSTSSLRLSTMRRVFSIRSERPVIFSRLSRIGCSRGMLDVAPNMVEKNPGGLRGISGLPSALRLPNRKLWRPGFGSIYTKRRSTSRRAGRLRNAAIAWLKGAFARTEPSISIVSSAALAANCCGNIRFKNALRPSHVTFSRVSKRSSSRTEKGGKAPGKLAVARAANINSAISASPVRPRVEKSTVMRCSDSVTSSGLFRRKT